MRMFAHIRIFVLTKTELAEELGNRLIWADIPWFLRDFPGAGEVDLSRSTSIPSQASLTACKLSTAFSMRGDDGVERYVASCSTSPAFSKKRRWSVFDLIDVLIFSETKSWYDLPAVGRFRSSGRSTLLRRMMRLLSWEISRSWRSWSVRVH